MKKLAEKVAIVALICISFVFVLLAVLYATNVIPQIEVENNSVAIVVLSVLSVLFVGLSVYLLIVNFSEVINVKRIVLFYDANTTTRASYKVVNNIVYGCAKEFPQLKIKRTTFRVDDKMGLVANIYLESLVAEDIAIYVPKLRNLLEQSFSEAIGLKFNAINFEVTKLSKKFTPADTLVEAANQTPAQEAAPVEEEAVAEQPATEQTETTDTAEATETADDHKQEDIAAGEESDVQTNE